MLKAITELVVRIADLAEAEGRSLRKAVAKLAISLSLYLVAAILVLIGAVGLIAALWLALRTSLDPAAASGLTAVLALGLSAAVYYAASRSNQ